jgi:branched-chain amino acid transport system substrate-binding protein
MWDAMTALDLALQKTEGGGAPDVLVAALQGVSFNSPRGAFAFDQGTHNVVQDIYIRQVQATGLATSNVVVGTIPKVSDPGR